MNAFVSALALAMTIAWALPGWAADDRKVKAATGQVESGARKIGKGKIGEGVEETAKGIGNTVVEGAKYSGEKLKEAGKAAEPKAKTTWQHVKDGASSFGQSVKNFFSNLF
ncbi:MAG TPA: hypothetical protein VFR64_01130 [Methylomirabilota bacterium]|nr:hypothetical protein [Methylomirabilota bacterium]